MVWVPHGTWLLGRLWKELGQNGVGGLVSPEILGLVNGWLVWSHLAQLPRVWRDTGGFPRALRDHLTLEFLG